MLGLTILRPCSDIMSLRTIAFFTVVSRIAAMDSLREELYIDISLSYIKPSESGSAPIPNAYMHARDLPDKSCCKSTSLGDTLLREFIWTHAYYPATFFEVSTEDDNDSNCFRSSQGHRVRVERVLWLSLFLAHRQEVIEDIPRPWVYPCRSTNKVAYDSRHQTVSAKRFCAIRRSRSKRSQSLHVSTSAKTVLLAARQPKFIK